MKHVFLGLALVLATMSAFAQPLQLSAKKVAPKTNATALASQFEAYSLFALNVPELLPQLPTTQDATLNVNFSFPGIFTLETALQETHLLDDDYVTLIQSETGMLTVHEKPDVKTYRGTINGRPKSRVAITLAGSTLSGSFDLGDGNIYFIEPLQQYSVKAGKNDHILYNSSDALDSGTDRKNLAKAVEGYQEKVNLDDLQETTKPIPSCVPKKLEVAIANDYQMVELFGTAGNVIAHNLTIMNLVQGNFDNEFIYPVRIKINAIFVSSCATCDPWPLTSDYDLLYIEFADWMNNGGFGNVSFDWALLLTPREIDGNISGYTYPNGMCEYYRASLVINYTPILCKLQKHVAHGIGVSMGAGNTATGIMAVGGVCTDAWEPISVQQINYAILTKPCLSTCVAQAPAQPEQPCVYVGWPGGPICFTFNAPCVGSYIVGTDDPNLAVTTTGTTICLESLTQEDHNSHVYITAVDHCGKIDPFGISVVWNVCRYYHELNPPANPDDRDADTTADMKNGLQITQNNDFVYISDPAVEPGQKTVHLLDMNGKLMLERLESAAQIQIPLQELPQGMYVVRVNAGQSVKVEKVYRF